MLNAHNETGVIDTSLACQQSSYEVPFTRIEALPRFPLSFGGNGSQENLMMLFASYHDLAKIIADTTSFELVAR
ncbi:unnamed protein product [Lathyrus sativus]|nr:unnamed protein product [Lathyrus sativus]